MTLSRRRMIHSLVLGAGSGLLPSCERAVTEVTKQLGQSVPEQLAVASAAEVDADFHLLSRASFGAWPGELDRLKAMGRAAWIEEQLQPQGIDDALCEARVAWFESIATNIADAYDYRREVLRDELTRHALLRAVYSRRQLFEVMVEFWTDHLNIDLEKGDCVYLKPWDDREVIRRHALGNFHDLIRASATSPAMLTYLDGKTNKVRRGTKDKPNENYARELMELHTLGVHGGYTQDDVREAARCLSGWTFEPKRLLALDADRSFFRADWHDAGVKTVLGHSFGGGSEAKPAASRVPSAQAIRQVLFGQEPVSAPEHSQGNATGAAELDALVRLVCSHPSTALYIATKLCRRFVSYEPPASLVTRVAAEFTRTGGEIKAMLRVLLSSEEFYQARAALLKRPFRYVVSTLRLLAADTHAHASGPLFQALARMGQGLFQHPTPDGYPDDEAPWMGTLMWRWNLAIALAEGRAAGVSVPLYPLSKALQARPEDAQAWQQWFRHLHGRSATEDEARCFEAVTIDTRKTDVPPAEQMLRQQLGLMLAGPAFQRC